MIVCRFSYFDSGTLRKHGDIIQNFLIKGSDSNDSKMLVENISFYYRT